MNETATRMSQRDRQLDAPLSYPRVVNEPLAYTLEAKLVPWGPYAPGAGLAYAPTPSREE